MKVTAAVVPVRSAPFEVETLNLAAPLAEEVLVMPETTPTGAGLAVSAAIAQATGKCAIRRRTAAGRLGDAQHPSFGICGALS